MTIQQLLDKMQRFLCNRHMIISHNKENYNDISIIKEKETAAIE